MATGFLYESPCRATNHNKTRLKKNQNTPGPSEHPPVRGGEMSKCLGGSTAASTVVSHIQRIGCQPEKTTLHGGQSRSLCAEQGKENKRKIWQHTPPPTPPTARSEKKKKIKITRRIYRRYACLGRSRVRTRISSARRPGTRPMGVASQNSTLFSAIRPCLNVEIENVHRIRFCGQVSYFRSKRPY